MNPPEVKQYCVHICHYRVSAQAINSPSTRGRVFMQGERLRKIREQMGLSQEDLGDRLGLGNRQIWRYEHNQTRPSSEVVAAIARALSVSADFLLGLSDNPTPSLG